MFVPVLRVAELFSGDYRAIEDIIVDLETPGTAQPRTFPSFPPGDTSVALGWEHHRRPPICGIDHSEWVEFKISKGELPPWVKGTMPSLHLDKKCQFRTVLSTLYTTGLSLASPADIIAACQLVDTGDQRPIVELKYTPTPDSFSDATNSQFLHLKPPDPSNFAIVNSHSHVVKPTCMVVLKPERPDASFFAVVNTESNDLTLNSIGNSVLASILRKHRKAAVSKDGSRLAYKDGATNSFLWDRSQFAMTTWPPTRKRVKNTKTLAYRPYAPLPADVSDIAARIRWLDLAARNRPILNATMETEKHVVIPRVAGYADAVVGRDSNTLLIDRTKSFWTGVDENAPHRFSKTADSLIGELLDEPPRMKTALKLRSRVEILEKLQPTNIDRYQKEFDRDD